jgi:preprotein translocase subunit SecG
MGILITVLTIILVILSVLIVLIILLQSDKSSGMGILGGGGSQSAFGSSTADVLTKITGTMVALFMIIAFGLGMMESRRPKSVIDTIPTSENSDKPQVQTEEKSDMEAFDPNKLLKKEQKSPANDAKSQNKK